MMTRYHKIAAQKRCAGVWKKRTKWCKRKYGMEIHKTLNFGQGTIKMKIEQARKMKQEVPYDANFETQRMKNNIDKQKEVTYRN